MKTKVKLPHVLSELAQLALNDIEKTRNDPRYVLNMELWHAPASGRCEVCAAGAIMAQSLDAPFSKEVSPEDFDEHTEKALRAVDDLRAGWFQDAVEELGVNASQHQWKQLSRMGLQWEGFDAATEWEGFKHEMKSAIKELQEMGL